VTVGGTVTITPSLAGGGVGPFVFSCDDLTHWDPVSNTWSFTPAFNDGGSIKTVTFTVTDGVDTQSIETQVVVFRDFSALQKYSGNPIVPIIAGHTQSDTSYIRAAQKIGDTYYSITQGDVSGDTWTHLNLYTSTDLLTWTPYESNPVISESAYIVHPSVVKVGDLWHLYCSAGMQNSKVWLYTSTDLIHWTKYGQVWGGNPAGTNMAYSPCVIRIGSLLYMYYWTMDDAAARTADQEYATSTDGIAWTYGGVSFSARVPNWDYGYPESGFDPWVTQNAQGYYEQIYTLYSSVTASQVLGYAISADGKTWYKYPGAIIVPTGGSGDFDEKSVGDGCLFFLGGVLYLYYAGMNGSWITTGGLSCLIP
jgi:hypothetical protein